LFLTLLKIEGEKRGLLIINLVGENTLTGWTGDFFLFDVEMLVLLDFEGVGDLIKLAWVGY